MANFRRRNRDCERLARTLRALHFSAHAVSLLARAPCAIGAAARDERRNTL